ncbi:MAG TPA: hypothetical protein VF132_12785 [Rudaea sp.]
MEPDSQRKAWPLIRAVIALQLKLLLGAARDFAVIPIALGAALVDLVHLKKQPPQYFRSVLRLGEKTDQWIDVWYANHDAQGEPRENVDALLTRVEEVVRDPQSGARRARVLKRWAERQVARARQRAADEMARRKITDKNG